MKRIILLLFVISFISSNSKAESPYPIRGLCIAAPTVDSVDEFVEFIDNDLANDGLNLLVLRIDYRYEYKSHPELIDNNPYSKKDVKKLKQEVKRLQKELNRKDKALAETAALLVLSKKCQAIWGEKEVD